MNNIKVYEEGGEKVAKIKMELEIPIYLGEIGSPFEEDNAPDVITEEYVREKFLEIERLQLGEYVLNQMEYEENLERE
jgi:hypothetical protein